MISSTGQNGARGFTLIELLLAICIFVLVIGSIYASLHAATQALVVGRETMELYQTSRAGLNRMVVDLRRALAPASFPFNEEEEDEALLEDEYYLDNKVQLQVTFKGDSKEVQFVVRQEIDTDNGPTMDIREVRYKLADDKKLVKEIFRSLLKARLAELLARRSQERLPAQERKMGRDRPPAMSDGYMDKPIVQTISDNVSEIKFSYYDGENWRDSWDSEQIIINEFARDIDESELTEEDEEKIGLPRLVRVEMKVNEEIRLETSTSIPSADLNLVGARSDESDFGSAFRSSRDRLNRLRDRDRGRGRR